MTTTYSLKDITGFNCLVVNPTLCDYLVCDATSDDIQKMIYDGLYREGAIFYHPDTNDLYLCLHEEEAEELAEVGYQRYGTIFKNVDTGKTYAVLTSTFQ